MYQGFSDQPFNEGFDLILQGMPTVAMLIVNQAIRFADAGLPMAEDEVSGMRKLSGTLSEWAEWTGRGERYPLRGEDEDCLEHLTTGAS